MLPDLPDGTRSGLPPPAASPLCTCPSAGWAVRIKGRALPPMRAPCSGTNSTELQNLFLLPWNLLGHWTVWLRQKLESLHLRAWAVLVHREPGDQPVMVPEPLLGRPRRDETSPHLSSGMPGGPASAIQPRPVGSPAKPKTLRNSSACGLKTQCWGCLLRTVGSLDAELHMCLGVSGPPLLSGMWVFTHSFSSSSSSPAIQGSDWTPAGSALKMAGNRPRNCLTGPCLLRLL